MALRSDQEKDIERRAQNIANDAPMANHADSCPYLISNRRRNCRCNCFTFANNELRKKAGLSPEY